MPKQTPFELEWNLEGLEPYQPPAETAETEPSGPNIFESEEWNLAGMGTNKGRDTNLKKEAKFPEEDFRAWYAEMADAFNLNKDPDAPGQFYDYRAAFRAGAEPDDSGHWPSRFKLPGHPNEFVGGFSTITGERNPKLPRASEQELVKLGWDPAAAKQLAAMPEPETVQVDPDYKPTWGDSLARGADIVQSMMYGATEATGELTGLDTMAKWGREGREANEREISLSPKTQMANIDSPGAFLEWAKDMIGEQIPLMAPPIAGGIAGAAAGSTLGPAGATVGGLLGAFIPSYILGVGETQGNIKEKDPNAVAPGHAFGGGALIAAFDTALPGKIGSSLVRKFGRRLATEIAGELAKKPIEGIVKRTARGTITGLSTEGFTEAVQEAIGDVAAAHATGKGLDPNLGWRMFEAGASGALLGGVTGAVEGAAPHRRPAAGRPAPPDIGNEAGDVPLQREPPPSDLPPADVDITMPSGPTELDGEAPAGGIQIQPGQTAEPESLPTPTLTRREAMDIALEEAYQKIKQLGPEVDGEVLLEAYNRYVDQALWRMGHHGRAFADAMAQVRDEEIAAERERRRQEDLAAIKAREEMEAALHTARPTKAVTPTPEAAPEAPVAPPVGPEAPEAPVTGELPIIPSPTDDQGIIPSPTDDHGITPHPVSATEAERRRLLQKFRDKVGGAAPGAPTPAPTPEAAPVAPQPTPAPTPAPEAAPAAPAPTPAPTEETDEERAARWAKKIEERRAKRAGAGAPGPVAPEPVTAPVLPEATPVEPPDQDLESLLQQTEAAQRTRRSEINRLRSELEAPESPEREQAAREELQALEAEYEQVYREASEAGGDGDAMRAAVEKAEPERPFTVKSQEPSTGQTKAWKAIGENADGAPIYEDENGVRSIVKDGTRYTEPVALVPTRGGVRTEVRDRGDEFKTKEEVTPTPSVDLDDEINEVLGLRNGKLDPRLAALREKGATDGQIREALSRRFGIEGGTARRGVRTWQKGGNNPSATIEVDGQPAVKLTGKKLIDEARRRLDIPQPGESTTKQFVEEAPEPERASDETDVAEMTEKIRDILDERQAVEHIRDIDEESVWMRLFVDGDFYDHIVPGLGDEDVQFLRDRLAGFRDLAKQGELDRAEEDSLLSPEADKVLDRFAIELAVREGQEKLPGFEEEAIEGPIVFRSGNISSPADIEGYIKAGQPVGITAQSSSNIRERAIRYAQAGGKVFVDSGAFSHPDVDFTQVFSVYNDIYDQLTDEQRKNVYFVMPDVVGDVDATRKVQRQFSDEISKFSEGANAIVPVQVSDSMVFDVDRIVDNWPRAIIGLPGNKAAITDRQFSELIQRTKERHITPRGFHLLGIGEKNARFDRLMRQLRHAFPDAELSSDSNRTPALFGKGRPAQKHMEGLAERRGEAKVDVEWDGDTTEIAGQFFRGDLAQFTPKELTSFLEAIGLGEGDLGRLREAAKEGEVQEFVDATGLEDALFLAFNGVAKARMVKAERPGARTDTIAKFDEKKKAPTDLEQKKADIKAKREELLKKFRKKVEGEITSGVDPEILMLTAQILRTYIEELVVDFRMVARRFQEDLKSVGIDNPREYDDYIEVAWEDLKGEPVSVEDALGSTLDEEPTDGDTTPDSGDVEEPESPSGPGTPGEGDAGRTPGGSPGTGDAGPRVDGGEGAEPGPSGGTGDGFSGTPTDSPVDERPAAGEPGPVTTDGPVAANYRIRYTDQIGAGSAGQKYRQNIEAIKLAKQIKAENRYATAEEQRILVKYVGWGGLKRELSDSRWELISGGVMTRDEYDRAFQSTMNAHYTSEGMIQAMWNAVRNLGFERGRVLEPSMGVGHFIGLMPSEIRPTQVTGIELDPLTGLIGSLLYPQSKILVSGFQDAPLSNDYYDFAISNVPFGDYMVADPASKIPQFVRSAIHNYFFAKTLQKLRPGGMIAFITTHGTMDAAMSRDGRQYLDERADFLGAVRLPSTAFKGNAGTEVVTDIIFMRKRATNEPNRSVFKDWIETEYKYQSAENPQGIPISKYFIANPGRVIGKMGAQGTMYAGGGTELSVKFDGDVAAVANTLLKELTDDIVKQGLAYSADPVISRSQPAEVAPTDIIEQMYYLNEKGEVRQRLNGQGEIVDKNQAVIKSYIGLRDAFRALVAKMRDPDASDADVAKLRPAMKRAYDRFVDKFGALHLAKNAKVILGDVFGPAVLAVEEWDPEKKRASESAIFRQRTINPTLRVDKAESPAHALMVSLTETGDISWNRIAELLGLTPDEAKKELIESGRVFETPNRTYEIAERYLSGRVRDKLREAEAAAEAEPETFERNVKALKEVVPKDLPVERIATHLGAPWIPKAVVDQFIAYLGGTNIKAHYRAATAEWGIEAPGGRRHGAYVNETAKRWITNRVGLAAMLKATLNNQQVIVRDEDGKIEEKPTIEAQAKQALIKREFNRWITADDDRVDGIVTTYNNIYNATALATYNGDHLTLPGMSEHWRAKLNPHQRNAIWRAILEGNTYLAHTMGAGKTIVMAAIAMEYRRLGLAKKPIIVIPKQTLGDYAKFGEYYPGARVLIGTKDQTQGAARKQFMARIATGDYDAIVVTREAMKAMPAGPAAWKEYINEQLEELRAAKEEEDAQRQKAGQRRMRISDIAKAIERLEQRLKEIEKKAEMKKDQGLMWEDLGIDMILADEAHGYRKQHIVSNLRNVGGVPQGSGSGRGNDLYIKARQIHKNTPGRNLVFASGTPIVNSMAELWVVQRFLQPEVLRMAGVEKFDAWASTFGNIAVKFQGDVTGTKLKAKSLFAEFTNMNALIQMFRSVMDVMLPEDLNLPVPKVTGGEARLNAVEGGPRLKAFMEHIAERVKNMDWSTPHIDNMFMVSMDARKAALDLRMLGIETPGNKLPKVAERILEKAKEWEKQKGTQLVFMELGVPGDDKFSTYTELKDLLVRGGMKPEHVAFIQESGKSDAKRDEMFAKMRSGDIRVLIGPRETMGTGVNVQRRLVAMHHVDPHWLPALIEQADGRGIRQGNAFYEEGPEKVDGFTMDINHYVTKGSFDAYMWNAVAWKATMINQAMRGNLSLDRIEDVSGGPVFDPELFAVVGFDNQLLLDRMNLTRRIEELLVIADAFEKEMRERHKVLATYPQEVKKAKDTLAELEKVSESFQTVSVTIGETTSDTPVLFVPDEAITIAGLDDTGRFSDLGRTTVDGGVEFRGPKKALESLRKELNDRAAEDEGGYGHTDEDKARLKKAIEKITEKTEPVPFSEIEAKTKALNEATQKEYEDALDKVLAEAEKEIEGSKEWAGLSDNIRGKRKNEALAYARRQFDETWNASHKATSASVPLKGADDALRKLLGKVTTLTEAVALPDSKLSTDNYGHTRVDVPVGTMNGYELFAVYTVSGLGTAKELVGTLMMRTPAGSFTSSGLSVQPVTRLVLALPIDIHFRKESFQDELSRKEAALEEAEKNRDLDFPEREELETAKRKLIEVEEKLGKTKSVTPVQDPDEVEEIDEDEDEDDDGGSTYGDWLSDESESFDSYDDDSYDEDSYDDEDAFESYDEAQDARGPRKKKGKAPETPPPPIDPTVRSAPIPTSGPSDQQLTAHPMELPEIVAYMKDLLINGTVVRGFRKVGKLGEFLPDGRIRLHKAIFKDTQQAAEVLAHELGHATDWLPDKDIERGNVLGRLLTLKRFVKGSFTDPNDGTVIKNREVKAELQRLSDFWRPWNPDTASKQFKEYRRSSVELYADAISVLFNNPGLLQSVAPTFYDAFFKYLDEKPAVKAEYFELQALLSGDRDELIRRTRNRVRAGMEAGTKKAIELQREVEAGRREDRHSINTHLRMWFVDRNTRIIDLRNDLLKRGIVIPEDEDPLYFLREYNYLGSLQNGWLRREIQPIYRGVQDKGVSWMDVGETLLNDRIAKGDRSTLANPHGITVKRATEMQEQLDKQLGEQGAKTTHAAAEDLREALRGVIDDAYDAGLWSDKTKEMMDENQWYTPFQVVEHMDENITWQVIKQVGTFKDIANPADSLVLKALAIQRAAERNKVTSSVVRFLEEHFPDEIEDANTVWNPKYKIHEPVEPHPRDRKNKQLIKYYRRGKLVGKYVDPYIAAAVNHDSVGHNRALMRVLNLFTGAPFFRAVFTGYNPGFHLWNFQRDFMRFWKNIPGMTLLKAAKLYARALPAAYVRAGSPTVSTKTGSVVGGVIGGMAGAALGGIPGAAVGASIGASAGAFGANVNHVLSSLFGFKIDIADAEGRVRDAEAARVLGVTYSDLVAESTDSQVEDLFARRGIEGKPRKLNPDDYNKLIRPGVAAVNAAKPFVDFLKAVGDITETLPKMAAIEYLSKDQTANGLTPMQRDFIRRMVGSPDFLAGGIFTPVSNKILIYSNAALQGQRSDYKLFKDSAKNLLGKVPGESRMMTSEGMKNSGLLWKTVAVNILPKIMLYALLKGMFDDLWGDEPREIVERGASEYDRTNYTVIPLGRDGVNGVIARIPQDFSGQLLGGLFWKFLQWGGGDASALKTMQQVVDYTAGQIPSPTPSYDFYANTLQMITGRNPYDWYRGRTVLTQQEQTARESARGQSEAWKKYVGWEFQQLGGGVVWKFYPGERPRVKTPTQEFLETPFLSNIIGRTIKSSSYGLTESLMKEQQRVQGEEAAANADENDAVMAEVDAIRRLPTAQRRREINSRATRLARELYPDMPTAQRNRQRADIRRKLTMAMSRGQGDPILDRLMASTSNSQRAAIIKRARRDMTTAEYNEWMRNAREARIVTPALERMVEEDEETVEGE